MTDVLAGNLGDEQLIGASKGIACTTTPAVTAIPNGVTHLTLMPRNVTTAVVVKYAINPYLVVVRQDGASTFVDVSDEAQDGDTSDISFDALDVIANDEAIYIGSHQRFRGVKVNMVAGNINGTNSVLTVRYWQAGSPSSWTDISDTDGTASGGATFAQDGNVTWTTPSDWEMETLIGIASVASPDPTLANAKLIPNNLAPMFWTRWEVSVQLDADVGVEEFLSLYDTTGKTYPEMPVPQIVARERRIKKGTFGAGNIELLTDAGTANVVVVGAAVGSSARFP